MIDRWRVIRRIVEAGIVLSLCVYLVLHLNGFSTDTESKPIIAALLLSLVELVLVSREESRKAKGGRVR